MFATLTETGQTFPIDSITETGIYLRIMGHARFFPAALVIVH